MTKIAALIALSSILAASPAMAQGNSHGHGNGKAKVHTKQEVKKNGQVVTKTKIVERDDDYRDGSYNVQGKRGSPAFCRSGAGHPKFGRAWCIDKGFGLGSSWNRSRWDNVVFRTQRQATIGDVLSSVILGRLSNYATSTLGLRTPLAGTWLTSDTGSRVYVVRSGSSQVAELVDTNRDGRADYVLLHNR